MRKLPNRNGRVIYHGPSQINGDTIVAIITGLSEWSNNPKTGPMLQSWILPADIQPQLAFTTAAGISVCGSCQHHGTRDASCYVNWWQSPSAIWSCWHHGRGYAPAQPGDFKAAALRIGSAGDPCAVPGAIWQQVLSEVRSHTGYTHLWREPHAAWARGLLQASCDSFADYLEASAAGWRTYLVVPPAAIAPMNAVRCPASAEAQHSTTCSSCLRCDGKTGDVVIDIHGSRAQRFTPVI